MTVQRKTSIVVKLTAPDASRIVEQVFSNGQQGYSYVDTVFNDARTSATTTIRPKWWPLLLSTQFSVDIEQRDDGESTLTARTKSQPFLFGDVFNFYGGYVNDFFSSVHETSGRAT